MEDRELLGFNSTIFHCIDTALNALGESSKLALYYQVASKYGLESSEFESRPAELAERLHALLGDVGYSFVEKLIIREVCSTFGLAPKDGMRLSEAISEARKKYLARD